MSKEGEFASEGFDLSAVPASDDGEVIYEIGGGTTTVIPKNENKEQKETKASEDKISPNNPIHKSEELKGLGNEQFKLGNHLDAYDYYTDAIEACPGMTGSEITKLMEEHEEREREKIMRMNSREAHRRTMRTHSSRDGNNEDDGKKATASSEEGDTKNKDEDENDDDSDSDSKPVEFELPPHEYGTQLSVYYSNRAACLLHLGRYDDAVNDCNISILLNPKYAKAYIRRMTAYEKTERTDDALKDAKTAQEIDPKNRDIWRHVQRLQKIEDERLEKLKEETMGKLKDLGNSILGNFGMSLDNFKAEKDPNTGSYNLSFQS